MKTTRQHFFKIHAMKNILVYSVILGLFVLTGCEQTLDEELQTGFSEEQVFSSEEGLESALNGLYVSYSGGAYHGSAYHGLLAPISGKFYSNQGASEDATSLNCTPINTWLTRLWPSMYETVNIANLIISNIEGAPEDAFTNGNSVLGQAYFIRAATYFDMVRLFGGVPIRTESVNKETLYLPRNSKQEVYDLIIADFNRAKELLGEPGAVTPGRPAKYAANMFLAKVYMTLAGEDNGNPALWQNAYDEAIVVLDKYSLTPTYAELFEPGNENTSESIFEIQYGQNGAIRNSDVVRFYTPQQSLFAPPEQTTFGRVKPNKEVFDSHINQYPGDPRIDATFIYNSYDRLRGGRIQPQSIYPNQLTGNFGFPFLRKYLDPTFNGTTTSRNMLKLRYADLLLMLAEIENELNGPGNAYQYVNEVLARARNTADGTADQPADFAGLSQDEFRTRILKERQYELLGEGHEWYDTRRRGYEYFLEEVVEEHNTHPTFDNRTDYVYPVSVKNMLLPIPSDELAANRELSPADQNPGY